ncbi:MAG: hypothetical protein ACKORA_04220, partial [Solirubrobacterales bacterium]
MEQARPKSSDDGIVVIGTGRLGGSVARSLDADGVEVGVAGSGTVWRGWREKAPPGLSTGARAPSPVAPLVWPIADGTASESAIV